MASMTIIVLCPHGRRQTVKASPNTSILQVLEQACQKQGIKPEDFEIRHYNKPLDLSLSIRFANLPNNALLELNPITNIRQDGAVTVCLQLESGERFTEHFSPSATIWDIIEKCHNPQNWSQGEINGEIVCIYMRQKIIGEKLKTTTLRGLGLTKGKAIIRLMYRQPQELSEQAHVSMPITKAVPFSEEKISPDHSSNKHFRLDGSPESKEQIQEQNYDKKDVKIGKSEKELKKPVDKNKKQITKNDLHEAASNYRYNATDVNANKSAIQQEQPVFNKDAEINITKLREEIGEIIYLGARNAVLFNLEDILEVKKTDIPDEFFELTINDVRYLMDELKKDRQNCENEPLMLKSQRESRMSQQFRCYKQTVIRIYFPDKFVLQGTFIAEETVQAVWDFVRGYLENKELNFYLYTTPPKQKLQPETTLLQSRLIPAAVVYFGCETHYNSYLHPQIKSKISDPRAATLEAIVSRKQKKVVDDEPTVKTEMLKEPTVSTESMEVNVERYVPPARDIKTPKWFKVGKK